MFIIIFLGELTAYGVPVDLERLEWIVNRRPVLYFDTLDVICFGEIDFSNFRSIRVAFICEVHVDDVLISRYTSYKHDNPLYQCIMVFTEEPDAGWYSTKALNHVPNIQY